MDVEGSETDCKLLGVTWKQRTLPGAVEAYGGLALTTVRPQRRSAEARAPEAALRPRDVVRRMMSDVKVKMKSRPLTVEQRAGGLILTPKIWTSGITRAVKIV